MSSTPRLAPTRPKELLSSARWALGVVWRHSRWPALGFVSTVLLRGAVPAGIALAARGLINAAVAAAAMVAAGAEIDLGPLLPWLGLAFGLTLIEGLGGLVQRLCGKRLHDDVNVAISSRILERAAELDLGFFESPKQQEVVARAQHDAAAHISRFVVDGMGAVMFVVQAASLTAVLAAIEPLVLLIVVPVALPFVVFQWRQANRRYRTEYGRTDKRRWTRYFVRQLTSPRSVAEVRLLGLGPLLIERFGELMEGFRAEDRRLQLRDLAGSSVFMVITTGLFYLLFVRVALRAVGGALTVGDLAIYSGAVARLRTMLETGIGKGMVALEQSLYVANIRLFLAAEPRVVSGGGEASHASAGGALRVEGVTFRYDGGDEPALRDVSLEIDAGETVAIVGENGAGKSTLVKLIARLYDPDQGRILLDGVAIDSIALEQLHRRIALLYQPFVRYEATAAENIAYGNWRELLGRPERVAEVAREAGVAELIESMPQGYETMLGRTFGEHEPSAGQWHRIAIARVLARAAPLLILDEPTANLDARAESELFERLGELAAGRTTIVISHRFSTVAMADRIIVMSQGMIVESGTHAELLARRGHYAQLFELHERYRLKVEQATDVR